MAAADYARNVRADASFKLTVQGFLFVVDFHSDDGTVVMKCDSLDIVELYDDVSAFLEGK